MGLPLPWAFRSGIASLLLLTPLGLLHAEPPSSPKADSSSVRDAEALPKKVTSAEGITEYKLENTYTKPATD